MIFFLRKKRTALYNHDNQQFIKTYFIQNLLVFLHFILILYKTARATGAKESKVQDYRYTQTG